ncbi:MAG: hypothetical protein HKM07_08395, partial [Chlamydiae bacterium]|nr:hypothetical protein [Chlamydiota bacterium]
MKVKIPFNSPAAQEMAESLLRGEADMTDDDSLHEDQKAQERLPFSAHQRIIRACETNLKVHDEHLVNDRKYLVRQLDLLISDLERIITEKENNTTLTRSDHAVWNTFKRNPLISFVELLREHISDEKYDRQDMLRKFSTAIRVFRNNEKSYYQQEPRLYEKLEEIYYAALALDHLPRDWSSNEEYREDIKTSLRIVLRKNQHDDFYRRLKNTKTDYRNQIFDNLDSIILQATNRDSLIQSIQILIEEVKRKDLVLADYLLVQLKQWSDGTLADSLEDKLDGTRKQLLTKKNHHTRWSDEQTSNFQSTQMEILEKMEDAKQAISAISKIFSENIAPTNTLQKAAVRTWIAQFNQLYDPIII